MRAVFLHTAVKQDYLHAQQQGPNEHCLPAHCDLACYEDTFSAVYSSRDLMSAVLQTAVGHTVASCQCGAPGTDVLLGAGE